MLRASLCGNLTKRGKRVFDLAYEEKEVCVIMWCIKLRHFQLEFGEIGD